jgi:hypothetical protein
MRSTCLRISLFSEFYGHKQILMVFREWLHRFLAVIHFGQPEALLVFALSETIHIRQRKQNKGGEYLQLFPNNSEYLRVFGKKGKCFSNRRSYMSSTLCSPIPARNFNAVTATKPLAMLRRLQQ